MWAAAGSYLGFVLNFLGIALLARYLSPREFGTYALAQSYHLMLLTLSALVPGQAVVQSNPGRAAIADTALRMTVALRLALLLLSLPLSYLLQRHHGRSVGLLFLVLALIQVADGIRSAMGAVLERDLRYRLVTTVTTVSAAVSVVISIFVAALGGGVYSLVVREAVPSFTVLASYGFLARKWGLPTGIGWNRESARHIWTFGKGLFWIRLLDQLSARLDRLLLGNLLTLDAVGYYSQARYFATLPMAAVAPANQQVAAVTYCKLKDDSRRLTQAFNTVQYFVLRVVPVLGVGCALWPAEILTLLYGPGWASAAGPLRILSLYLVAAPALETYRTLMTAAENWRVLRWAAALQSLILCIGLLVFARLFGVEGAAIAAVLALGGGMLFLVAATRRLFGPGHGGAPGVVLVASVLAALAGEGISGVLPGSGASRLFAGFSVVVLCYSASLFLMERRSLIRRLTTLSQLARGRDTAAPPP